MGYQDKYKKLQEMIAGYEKVVVAFSGGVDSTFLLKAAVEALGKTNVLACIGVSASLSGHQLAQAKEMARLIDVEMVALPLTELEDPNYQANKADRCFHCKSVQFGLIKRHGDLRGFDHVLCGTNFDDKDDYRPGNRAVIALGIHTPLMDAELTKAEIRTLSKKMGLPTADAPASPCLASRIAYGQTITKENLSQVEQAEDVMRAMGFVEFRVRHHGNVARIEVPTEDIKKMTSQPFRKHLVEQLKAIGFQYISLDLEGFRSGSLNESLTEEEKQE